MSSEPLADVRDMYMAHIMFRREIGLAPALIRGVAAGDLERAAIVADHLDLILLVLEHHHRSEDEHLWPRLATRAGADAEAVVRTMESQHSEVDTLVGRLSTGLAAWRVSAGPAQGAELVDVSTLLSSRLDEHLQTEEQQALPLIEQHITAAEWGRMVAEGAAGIAPEQIPLIFGLMSYEGDPETVKEVIASMPPEVSSVIGDLAAQAFADHALRVHATATPARIGAREGGTAQT
jgi:hypothetical protein